MMSSQYIRYHNDVIVINSFYRMLSDINFVPYSMNIIIMGVASPAMRAHSSVLGKIPTIGFDIASFLNKYQVCTFYM